MKDTNSKPLPGKTVATTTICMEPKTLTKAKDRAKKQRRSFSGYVETLIQQDLTGVKAA